LAAHTLHRGPSPSTAKYRPSPRLSSLL
jgi:hypothetical protein